MATTGASLTGRARQLNAKKQNAEPALAVAERGYTAESLPAPIAELMDELYLGQSRRQGCPKVKLWQLWRATVPRSRCRP
jgi:hypothetical protein